MGAGGEGAQSGAPMGAGGEGGEGGEGGAGGEPAGSSLLEVILQELRANSVAAANARSHSDGWPIAVSGGYLFVSTNLQVTMLATEHDSWVEHPMTVEDDFAWIVLEVPPDTRYRLQGGAAVADPWSRAYNFDAATEVSLVAPSGAHLERFFDVERTGASRTVRVWVPAAAPTHVLYAHDAQDLFDPSSVGGGWHLQDSAPAGMLIVGIDNTADRFDELTPSLDELAGSPVGGNIAHYESLLTDTVEPLVTEHFGAIAKVGVLGSSLGGLASLYLAYANPEKYDFAASLSGTVGWGSQAPDVHESTLLDFYAEQGHGSTYLYLDSGGAGTCIDGDGDGVEDDADDASDNYCENAQLYRLLKTLGYVEGVDLTYVWTKDAKHDASAWGARVSVPLELFAKL
jgi:predicted alpha/beta superfamily hydrolase